ncbi:GMC family oxidoreductase N-terminal domain-containing protein [Actinophytocola glycyrrhizae]|uniref:GMC family oxidoreductase N-terminal domain-containing protein n=1 Tax=Actinophytocola glycyrrhizae TaxID=2044873 RepID=A0ABV9RTV2_9PSEU
MRDAIVVGAGGGGPVLAKELAGRGLDVLVLEAGPFHRDPEREWSRYENDCNNPADGYFRFGSSDRFEQPPWYREQPQYSFVFQLAGTGGTTQHYFGNSPRAMPGVFAGYTGADRAAYDVAHRFPFGYRDLIPYYEWVEATLPVQTAAMGTKEALFFHGCERAGLPVNTTKDILRESFRPQENAILQPGGTAGRTDDSARLLFPQATGCTFCGYCFQGCLEPRRASRNLKAKRQTDNSYVPMMLTAHRWGGRRATLVPDAFVTEVLTEQRGGRTVARGVRWRDTRSGAVHEETAAVVVLSGGCTENPRLWLNSGLPNPNGWVGRGYTDHAIDWVIGVFDSYTGNSKGAASSARADFPGRGAIEQVGLPPALQALSLGLSDSGVRGAYDNGRGPVGAWDGRAGRVVGAELEAVLSDVDRLVNVLVLTDDDVEPDNRVLRSVFPPDEHGPIPKVVFDQRTRSLRTRRNREFLCDRAATVLRAAGARTVLRMDFPPVPLHVHSTMRTGTDPADSVLDEHAEARWVDRLFVGDNSALANALGGPNPTLTTQALATRTAERIVAKYFGGDPWVRSETPVSSLDDRVTQGVLDGALD